MDDYDGKYLWDAHRAGKRILEFTDNREFKDYLDDAMLRSAVERQFEIIGEALRRLRDRENEDLVSKLAGASQAIAFRNRLAHGYDAINDTSVWKIIRGPLPDLLSELEHHLSKFDY